MLDKKKTAARCEQRAAAAREVGLGSLGLGADGLEHPAAVGGQVLDLVRTGQVPLAVEVLDLAELGREITDRGIHLAMRGDSHGHATGLLPMEEDLDQVVARVDAGVAEDDQAGRTVETGAVARDQTRLAAVVAWLELQHAGDGLETLVHRLLKSRLDLLGHLGAGSSPLGLQIGNHLGDHLRVEGGGGHGGLLIAGDLGLTQAIAGALDGRVVGEVDRDAGLVSGTEAIDSRGDLGTVTDDHAQNV